MIFESLQLVYNLTKQYYFCYEVMV